MGNTNTLNTLQQDFSGLEYANVHREFLRRDYSKRNLRVWIHLTIGPFHIRNTLHNCENIVRKHFSFLNWNLNSFAKVYLLLNRSVWSWSLLPSRVISSLLNSRRCFRITFALLIKDENNEEKGPFCYFLKYIVLLLIWLRKPLDGLFGCVCGSQFWQSPWLLSNLLLH